MIEEIIERFIGKYPDYAHQDTAWGMCYQASFRLRRFLRSAGIKAHLLHCENFRLKPPPRICASTLVLCPEPCLWNHFVVCAETADNIIVLDPTAKQFDTEYPAVRKMGIVQLQNEWLYYREFPRARKTIAGARGMPRGG